MIITYEQGGVGVSSPEPIRPLSPHFFKREADGSVRLRIRFTPEEAALIEEAAGDTPLLLYIHRVLGERARYHIAKAEDERQRNFGHNRNDRD
jgi:hypothetical protein